MKYISSKIERGEKLEEILSSQFSKQDSSSKLMIFHPNTGWRLSVYEVRLEFRIMLIFFHRIGSSS